MLIRSTTTLLTLALLLLASCQSQPTSRMPRSLAAPVDSTKSLLAKLLSPTALGRRIGNIADRGKGLAREEVDLGTMRSTGMRCWPACWSATLKSVPCQVKAWYSATY